MGDDKLIAVIYAAALLIWLLGQSGLAGGRWRRQSMWLALALVVVGMIYALAAWLRG